MRFDRKIRSLVCLLLCAGAATIISVCTRSDEQTTKQPRRVVDRVAVAGTDWWYEDLPPEWYQQKIDPFADQSESVTSIATVPELIQDAMNSQEVVPFVGQ